MMAIVLFRLNVLFPTPIPALHQTQCSLHKKVIIYDLNEPLEQSYNFVAFHLNALIIVHLFATRSSTNWHIR